MEALEVNSVGLLTDFIWLAFVKVALYFQD